jgi:hypothetical protein
MGDVGAAWWLWMVVLGGSGFVLGSLVLFAMPAPVIPRLVAVGLVLAALVLAASHLARAPVTWRDRLPSRGMRRKWRVPELPR